MDPQTVAEQVRAGDLRAAARLMRDIDDGLPQAQEALKLLYPHGQQARVVGITGSPGVGKSTLTDALVGAYRAQGLTVGVVAVDPTSPFSGGAILGDRVRMQRHATDEGVFIRSLATRGHFGGLTASTRGVVTVMAAMGKDVVLVETVGVGQDEVDIVRTADTTLVVTVPGLGDDVQAIKAGILEVGDIFVVNKMDRPGAAAAARQLEAMLDMELDRERWAGWRPPVVLTCAHDGRGVDQLVEAIADHQRLLAADGGRLMIRRRRQRARMELVDLVKSRLLARLEERLETSGRLEELAERIAQGQADPYSVCEQVLAELEGGDL
jgi:LAO/AO transport system kinase